MSDRAVTVSDPQGQAVLGRALARWREDAAIAHLAREGAALLVLDGTADRLLHAAGAAAAYGAGVAGPDGTVMPALRLSEQVRRAGPVGERPRMVRLRLDPRGVAPPVVVLLARAALDEAREALLLAPLGPLPALRPSESLFGLNEDASAAEAQDDAATPEAAPGR